MGASRLIKEAIAKQGLRQIDLLDIFGTRGRASEIVNGKREPSKAMALKLSKRLDIPLADLLEVASEEKEMELNIDPVCPAVAIEFQEES